jgi:hypothetical protein
VWGRTPRTETEDDVTKNATTGKCRRCSATGSVDLGGGNLVTCRNCGGCGRVLVGEARREAIAAYRRRCDLIRVLNTAAEQLGRDTADAVQAGRDHLETHAPDRHARLLDSVEQGRTDAVVAALVGYAAANVYARTA